GGDTHRRLDAKDVAVEASFADEHAHFARSFENSQRLLLRRLPGFSLAHQLHAEHQSHAANVADQLVTLRELLQSILQALAQNARVFLQSLFIDDVENGESGSHANRITAERIEVDALGEGLGNLHSSRDRRERHTVADAFRHGDEIGNNAEVFESPVVIAGASETGLYFIGNAQAAILAGDRISFAQIIRRAVRRPSH